MKYIVIETQNGAALMNVYDTKKDAYAAYYTILSVAATSEIDNHGAMLLATNGDLLDRKMFNIV